ncbi:ATP-dependent DNA helicase RRM3-like [Papaver somniferum]|uniref:ATP-dependent DNA helicase RRM3-like n=1 Tax=Papaver somniferum TaxID=3469 RepID=UPI000E6F6F19|nr:ATP-dependent DNA helicase RRM3-like [Papaver somniferum]
MHLSDKLNEDQSKDYDSIMGVIRRKESRVFFVDGPGGTGKTFLYRAILSTIRRNGGISIAAATSGVVATMLPGGRTAHLRFKLPFTPATTSTCDIAKNDKLVDLLRQATVIMLDEATMAHRYYVEAFDTTMRDITGNKNPFGGMIIIMGGDFRQVLPVVPKASRGKMVDSCLTRSDLWRHVEVLRLKKNMRAVGDTSYSKQ